MRKAWLAVALLVVALIFQLMVLNGVRLPGGGVPDLVLVVVAALAIVDGPVPGMVAGFAAGLSLDLAPPASQLIGQYALVFCLAGWAAGRLRGPAGRSAVRSVLFVAFVVVAAEVLSAAVGLALEPAQVTAAEVRHVLPYAIAYDLVLCPFVLYLVVLVTRWLTARQHSSQPANTLAVAGRPHQAAEGKRRRHEPRLSPAAARPGDGWVSFGPSRLHGTQPQRRRAPRLRPASGVAGSASGMARHHPRLPAAPVNLRLTAGHRGDGVIGMSLAVGSLRLPGRHPGMLAGASRQFRPHGGESGGSASGYVLPRKQTGRGAGAATIRFGGRAGDATIGRALGGAGLGSRGRLMTSVPKLRMTGSKSALSVRSQPRSVPKLHFSTRPAPVARRPAAAPTFRRGSSWLRPSTTAFGLVSGGVLDQSTFRAIRRQHVGTPRLRLAGHRRGSGVIGGARTVRRPARMSAGRPRQPRFGYGKKSLSSFLIGRHIGGRWLARRRVGSRSGVWLLGRRSGGVR